MVLFRRMILASFNSKRMLSKFNYDMVIVGGGMVGCALAACAGTSKYFDEKSILLLDSTKPKLWHFLPPPEFDIRVSAINPASVNMMEKIGVWSVINGLRQPQAVKQLRVWDSCSSSSIHFEYANTDDSVAYIVENTAILTALWRRLKDLKNVETTTDNSEVRRCYLPNTTTDDNLATVELENGATIKTKLLVGADGFNSSVRKAMDIHELNWPYRQKGIVATLQLADVENENNVAWQRFLPTGPIAILPLNKNTSSLVWTTTTSEADRLLSLTPQQFIDELNCALFSTDRENTIVNRVLSNVSIFNDNYAQYPPTIVALRSELAAFPLGFQHATNYVKAGVALVGDAAHRVHPLAGQGVNLGFGDVVCLVQELEQSIGRGEEFGALSVLQSYESQRQWHNLSVMMTVDGLNRLYSTSSTPIVLLRSVGLNLVNSIPQIKKFFMQRASA